MAIARLSKATLNCADNELGILTLGLMQFGQFHPIKASNSVQSMTLLILGSRAQEVYTDANELLHKDILKNVHSEKPQLREFKGRSIEEIIHSLEDELSTLAEVLVLTPRESELIEIYNLLRSIREAALAVFTNLDKILVIPSPSRMVTIQGFVPASSVDLLKELTQKYLVSVKPLDKQESQAPSTPSLVTNPRGISIFEDLTLQRGVPKYNEIDPTPMIAFVFPLFFGIMFGDVGHGLVLLFFGWYLYSRTKYVYWGKLLAVLGSSAFAVGILRGSFFGLEFASPVQRVLPLISALSAGVTLQNVSLILEIAIVVGTFHLGTAYAISFINAIRSNNYFEAFSNKLMTLVLYASIIPFGLAVAGTGLQFGILYSSQSPTPFFDLLLGLRVPVAVLAKDSLPFIIGSLIVLVASHPVQTYRSPHDKKEMLGAFTSGLLEIVAKPFEFFTNVLSYVRLGVLLITTYVLGSLVAGVLAFGILGGLLAAFLNILVIAMEGLIVYIQDMRLHLYEWLSKFYIGTGTAFKPIKSGGELSRLSLGYAPASQDHLA